MTALQLRCRALVKAVGDFTGYGNMMVLTQELWRDTALDDGYLAGSEFAIGPCVASTVACACADPANCEWCMGCGWLTGRVAHERAKQAS